MSGREDERLPPPIVPLAAQTTPAVWGAWATIGWGCLVLAVLVGTSVLVVLAFAVGHLLRHGSADAEALAELLGQGEVLAASGVLVSLTCTGLVVGIIKLKPGTDLRRYIGLQPVPARTYAVVAGVGLTMIGVADGVSILLGRPVVAPFMTEAYANCRDPVLLWLALVVAAPLFEEVFFRGFLLQGLRRSILRPWGAVVLTSLVWTAVHAGYDRYALASIFMAGLLLGVIWLRTGSIWPCVFLHAMMNIIATLETAWVAAHT